MKSSKQCLIFWSLSTKWSNQSIYRTSYHCGDKRSIKPIRIWHKITWRSQGGKSWVLSSKKTTSVLSDWRKPRVLLGMCYEWMNNWYNALITCLMALYIHLWVWDWRTSAHEGPLLRQPMNNVWHWGRSGFCYVLNGSFILYFPFPHNKLCLPPKFCINYCLC